MCQEWRCGNGVHERKEEGKVRGLTRERKVGEVEGRFNKAEREKVGK